MKKLTAITLALFSIACCTIPNHRNVSDRLPIKSYVKVTKLIYGVPKSFGSGFIVSSMPEGSLIVTAAHVCMPDSPFEQIAIKNIEGKQFLGVVLRMSLDLDACVVYVEDLNGPEISLAYEPPHPGDEVFSISSPHGFEATGENMVPVIRGTYSGEKTRMGVKNSIYHLRIAQGSSGGMIVNRYGRLVGMTQTFYMLGGGDLIYTDISTGMSYENLKEFLAPYKHH